MKNLLLYLIYPFVFILWLGMFIIIMMAKDKTGRLDI
jgi:hypothetical protein